MKNIFYKTVEALCIFIAIFPCLKAAAPVSVVNSLKGSVFRTLKGETRFLRPGDHIENFSEILTEEGGKIKFSDYFDNTYSLTGSGHIEFRNNILILKRGYLWIKSKQSTREFIIQTAHAFAAYKRGEAIISFDEQKRKTQLLVVKGKLRFGSLAEKMLSVDVQEGHFSFIKKDFNNERPRTPIAVGAQSLQKVTSLFEHFAPISIGNFELHQSPDKNVNKTLRKQRRSFAPIENKGRGPASFIEDKGTRIIVNIFGRQKQKTFVKTPSRTPASLGVPRTVPKADPFESALIKQYKKQTRHTDEVNSLIDALKSYQSDYSKSY